MKTESIESRLVEKLKQQLEHIDFAINFLENSLESHDKSKVAKKIISSVKTRSKKPLPKVKKVYPKYTKKNPHWMQRPENRAKVMKLVKNMQKGRK